MKSPNIFQHLISILALPFMVIVVIPFAIRDSFVEFEFVSWFQEYQWIASIMGVVFLIIGFPLFVQSLILFIKIGKGTLAPWNPTQKLVVRSLYQYVRNPMILGVLCILIAESFWFQSFNTFLWFLLFFTTCHLYFVFKEEPDLFKRFGEEYTIYKNNVPRWIPRKTPWRPES